MASMMMGAEVGMLIVETISKIRRAFFVQGKPIKAICRELRLSRKVVRKVLRSKATWRRLKGTNQLPKVIAGVRFENGIEVIQVPANHAA